MYDCDIIGDWNEDFEGTLATWMKGFTVEGTMGWIGRNKVMRVFN